MKICFAKLVHVVAYYMQLHNAFPSCSSDPSAEKPLDLTFKTNIGFCSLIWIGKSSNPRTNTRTEWADHRGIKETWCQYIYTGYIRCKEYIELIFTS